MSCFLLLEAFLITQFLFENFFITCRILLVWSFFLPPSPFSFPSPGAILHMPVNETLHFFFPESKIEEVFASDWEEVSGTSMAFYYNQHTLVIGSIHTWAYSVWSVHVLHHVWTRLTDTHAESQSVLYPHTCIDQEFVLRYCSCPIDSLAWELPQLLPIQQTRTNSNWTIKLLPPQQLTACLTVIYCFL